MIAGWDFSEGGQAYLYEYDSDGVGSVQVVEKIRTATVFDMHSQGALALTRDLISKGWTVHQEPSGETFWYHPSQEPLRVAMQSPAVSEVPSDARDTADVALKILCAILTIPGQARALAIEDAFELAERFLTYERSFAHNRRQQTNTTDE